ncbi:MAG: glycoside hydrolase family 3 C-terminal domain-containing protein [Candidatus Sulfotelmatobacter sp.]
MRKLIQVFVALSCAVSPAAQTQSAPASGKLVESIVGRMSLEEKIDYIGGTGFSIRAMPNLHLPALEMSDGPLGVRSNSRSPSTVYAAGIALAATWNRSLAERVGEGIGRDARARGIHFMLGPGVNIYRSPRNGRNFEYLGEDPFLASAMAVGYINGMQKQGVSATIKHFLANNSEFLRHDSDSVIDERTLREIYLPTFEAAVKQAHVGAVMDSYNLINGVHATQNGYFNTDIVRKQWGFEGIMMSDWRATYDGVAAANGGLDLEMPTGEFMNRAHLLPAVQDGRVKQQTIDDKIGHILQTAARFGWLDREQTDLSFSKYNELNHEIALQAACESVVLLKNDRRLLPLDQHSIKSILVAGPDAYPAQPVAGGSGAAVPFSSVSVVEGIAHLLGDSAVVYYEPGLPSLQELVSATSFVTEPQGGETGLKLERFDNADLSGSPQSVQVVKHISNSGFSWDTPSDGEDGAPLSASAPKVTTRRWIGYYIAHGSGPYEVALQASGENNGSRVWIDDRLIFDNWELAKAYLQQATLELASGPHKIVVEDLQHSRFGGRLRLAIAEQNQLVSDAARKLAARVDAVVVAVGFNRDSEGEGADRTFSLPIGQDALIRDMAAQNKNTIVSLTSGGAVDAASWIDQVPALLELWYPGEQGGKALAEVLFGDVNPSGRLPVTFEKRAEDNPAFSNYYPEPGTKKVVYKEGIFVGYRGYEHNHTKALFPFGFGLSYTTFNLSHLTIKNAGASAANYLVSFDVTNSGERAGAEVAQLYIADNGTAVPRPPKELKGFVKVSLKPGETQRVTVPLDTRSFAYFDADGKIWRAPAGTYKVLVGQASDEIDLTGEIKLAQTVTEQP